MIDSRIKGRVTAVIGPVGIDDADLGDGRLSVLGFEVFLAELQIRQVHRKSTLLQKPPQRVFVHCVKAADGLHPGGNFVFHLQCLEFLQRGFSGLYRIDDIFLYGFNVCISEIAGQDIDSGGTDLGTFPL